MRTTVAITILLTVLSGCRTARVVDTLVSKPNLPERSRLADVANTTSPSDVQPVSAQVGADGNTGHILPASQSTVSEMRPADTAYIEAMKQLEELGRTDPAARDQLWKQLQTVKPSLWPGAIQQFKSGYELGKIKNGNATPSRPAVVAPPMTYPAAPPATLPTTTPIPYPKTSSTDRIEAVRHASLDSDEPPVPMPSEREILSPQEELLPPRLFSDSHAITHASHVAKPVDYSVPRRQPSSWQEFRTQLLQADYESPAADGEHDEFDLGRDTPAAEVSPLSGRGSRMPDWRDSVDSAIVQLDTLASDNPRTRQEAYLQARQRMLQLVAGNKEAAVGSIPGLTPTEQSYWSHQMLALGTLLEEDSSRDMATRSAAAAHYLQDAADELGELATLEISQLAFFKTGTHCSYGDYEEEPDAKFGAGEAVNLYIQIENYRSESSSKGYRTSIEGSYQVLDAVGNVVEGDEFAPVNDQCRSRRRDFYMTYKFSLPQRVYPGEYKLKLLLHDRLADKLTSRTIDFEIVEDAGARR